MAEGGLGDAGVCRLLAAEPPGSQQRHRDSMQETLKREEQHRSVVQEQLDRTLRTLQLAKDCLEHLASKLNHVTVVGPPPPW